MRWRAIVEKRPLSRVLKRCFVCQCHDLLSCLMAQRTPRVNMPDSEIEINPVSEGNIMHEDNQEPGAGERGCMEAYGPGDPHAYAKARSFSDYKVAEHALPFTQSITHPCRFGGNRPSS